MFVRIIHDGGFTDEDYVQFRPVVYSNAILSLYAIITSMNDLNITFADEARMVSCC